MKHSFRCSTVVYAPWMLMLAALILPPAAGAQTTYNANVGAETQDQSVQADAHLPNEFWILEGDTIKWTFVPKNEVHTVTFLTAGQTRPLAPPPVGPPPPPIGPPFAFPPSCGPYSVPVVYDGTACVSSNPVSNGATFTVKFPKAGNYKMVCLVHTDMNGTVHVLVNNAANANLIRSQRFYDDQARDQAHDILTDRDHQGEESDDSGRNAVTAGIGEIVSTSGGGLQYRTVVRFLDGTIRIHKGESVEWTNRDPTEPHTVTFGEEPANFVPTTQVSLGAPAADGTLTGTVTSTGEFLNSGFIQAQAPDRTAPAPGSAQLPPGITRIRITFPNPGIYHYHCALHDVDGMLGTVIVLK
jgi:plastocyanin